MTPDVLATDQTNQSNDNNDAVAAGGAASGASSGVGVAAASNSENAGPSDVDPTSSSGGTGGVSVAQAAALAAHASSETTESWPQCDAPSVVVVGAPRSGKSAIIEWLQTGQQPAVPGYRKTHGARLIHITSVVQNGPSGAVFTAMSQPKQTNTASSSNSAVNSTSLAALNGNNENKIAAPNPATGIKPNNAGTNSTSNTSTTNQGVDVWEVGGDSRNTLLARSLLAIGPQAVLYTISLTDEKSVSYAQEILSIHRKLCPNAAVFVAATKSDDSAHHFEPVHMARERIFCTLRPTVFRVTSAITGSGIPDLYSAMWEAL